MENENEIVVPQTDTDTTENDELEINLDEEYSQEEDAEALRKEVETLKAQKEHWRKKATQPIQKTEQPKETPVLSEEVIEVKILKSQGLSDDLITQLKKIAKVNETGLIEAQADPYFVAFKEKLEEDQKKARASLGASKGSGQVKKGKDFQTAGLTDEEHKQLWRDRMGL